MYWHIFPTYGEAKDAVWRDPNMLFSIIPKELILKTNESELVVYLKNGSIYQLKGADQPDALRGPNPYGVVLDEFEKMKYAAWEVIEPILRANNGWCWFIGTPMGKNHLFTLFQRGQQESTEWKSWILKASTSGIIDPLQLAEARKSMSQALYNQEWECEFLEGEGSVFRGVREVMTAQFAKPTQDHYYVIGCDVAKVTDYTVLAVYDRQTNAQVYQDRFKTLEWPFQKRRIKAVADHFNRAVVVIDATGLGDPIADDLARANVAVESFKITEQSKKDLVEKLSIYIEQKRITMLPITETGFEFDNFSYTIGPTGKIRYEALQGFHDDIVMAHALAIHGLNPVQYERTEQSKTRIQQFFAAKQQQYDIEQTGDYLEGQDAGDWGME